MNVCYFADELHRLRGENRELRDQLSEAHRRIMAIGAPSAIRALSPRAPAPAAAPPEILAISPAALRSAPPLTSRAPLSYVAGQPPSPEDIDSAFATPTEGS